MCGIAGFWGEGTQPDLAAMTDAMSHRGPDAHGVWKHPRHPLYLGHRRLSIVDLTGGAQPMSTRDGRLTITYNGEIYNHEALRRELESLGHVFVSDHSDTEIILEAYREWGRDLHCHLNGMWAFALYDQQEELLFCSRDRLGEKPFYYALRGETFAFASELSALTRHPRVDAACDPLGVVKYFAYGYLPAPATIIKGCRKLPAGHYLVFNPRRNDVTVEKYWDLEFHEKPITFEDACDEADQLIRNSVDLRLRADVDVGVFLSGGVDSTLVASYAQEVRDQPVRTFNIGFEDPVYDESSYAEDVSRRIGSSYTSETFSFSQLDELVAAIAGKLDEPLADNSIVPTYLVSRVASKTVKVVLGGDGADELFSGYNPFKIISRLHQYRNGLPGGVKKLVEQVSAAGQRLAPASQRRNAQKLLRLLRSARHEEALQIPLWLGPGLDPSLLNEILGTNYDLETVYEEALACQHYCPAQHPADRLTYHYVKLYLQDDILAKVDRASMFNSIEMRSPFLDLNLLQFVSSLPAERKLHGGIAKAILKRILKQRLPAFEADRPKQGFSMPYPKPQVAGSQANGRSGAGGLPSIDWERVPVDNLAFAWCARFFNEWSTQRSDEISSLHR